MDEQLATVAFDLAGQHLTAYLAGELDEITCPCLFDQILECLHDDDEVVWLDVAAVTFCGSAGIALFVKLHQHVHGTGGRLTLYDPTPVVCRKRPGSRRSTSTCRSEPAAPRPGSHPTQVADRPPPRSDARHVRSSRRDGVDELRGEQAGRSPCSTRQRPAAAWRWTAQMTA